jgi:hypothetical protein
MVKDPVYGELTLQGPPWKMSGTPPHLKWIAVLLIPLMNLFILNIWGLGKNRLTEIKNEGIL